MTFKEIRLKAADLLESRPDAWCQGEFRKELASNEYAYCIVGACREVAGYYTANATDDAMYAAANVAADAAYAAYNTINDVADDGIIDDANANATGWNDALERTREEVIAILRSINKH